MKKFKSIFVFIFCLMAVGTLYGCGQKVEISFNQQIIEMVKGELLDIEDFLKIKNGYIEDVDFSSSNESVATVTPDYKFGAIGAGQAVITATVGEESVNVTIKVFSEVITLDSPQALRYDSTQNAIVWNAVYGKIDEDIFVANSYTVWCQKAGEEPEIFDNVLSPKFEIEEEGEYLVKVKTNARSEYVLGSDYCDAIIVTKLSAPTNVVFDEASSILTWDGNADCYEVSVNGVRTKANGKSMKLDLTNAGEYSVSVIALDENIENCIEAESETIKLTRLALPTLSIDNGRLAWNSQNGVGEYELTISKAGNPDRVEYVAGNISTYTLQGLSNGEYKVSIIAKGQKGYLPSAKSNEVSAIKLAGVTLSFDKNTKTLKVLENITNNVNVIVSYDDKNDTIVLNSENNYSYTWNYEDAKTYKIKAIVTEKNDNEILSDYSNEITIVQLAKTKTVEHIVSENKSLIKFAEVENANHYEIEVYKTDSDVATGLKTINEYNANGYELGKLDEIFNLAGDYRIIVFASNTSQNEATYILDSMQELSIKRLENVANVNYNETEEEKLITWDNVANKNSYKYEFIKDGQSFISDVITVMDSYEVSSFDFGEYTFKIKALGNNSTILDSKDYSEVKFDIKKTLESPVFTFDRENENLVINEVENASEYVLTLNDTEISVLPEFEGQKIIDVSSYVAVSGEYTFKVMACNKQNALLLDSQENSVIVTRLIAPEKIKLNLNETISAPEYSNATVLDSKKFTVKINGKETSKLEQVPTSEIEVKYNAKTDNVENRYYLDSPYSTFRVERLATPNAPKFENQLITWDLTESEANYDVIVEFIQDGNVLSINKGKNNSIDPTLSSVVQTIDISRDFNVRVKYKLGESEITGTGYASSLNSSEITLVRLATVSNIKVTGTDANAIISWGAITNAENYLLTITDPDGNPLSKVIEGTSYDQYIFDKVGVYNIKVDARSNNCINAEFVASATVERFANPTTVNVSNLEDLTINDKPNISKLDKVKIEIKVGDIATEIVGDVNLESIQGNFEVFVQYIAKQMDSGNEYYISSDKVSYKFARISKMESVRVNDGLIKWETSEDADGYELLFKKLGKENKKVIITNKNIGQIELSNSSIKEILEYFGAGAFNVSIRALKNEIKNLEKDVTGYLSCKDYSPETEITKLLQPTDVKVSCLDGDLEQTKLIVSWKHDHFDKTEKYNIICNGNIIGTVVGVTETTLENKFMESGNYSLTVVAVGNGVNISSNESEPFLFKRLTVPTGINVERNAILSWQNISGAVSYQLYYQLPTSAQLSKIVTNPTDLTSVITKDLELVEGITKVSIRAVGNGTDAFSSNISTAYNVDVLKKPTISLSTDKFAINGDYELSQKVVAKVTIKNENEDIIVVSDEKYDIGNEYSYPQLSAGKYIITAYAQSTNSTGYVNSMVVSKEFVKLDTPDDLHFIRTTLSNNDDYISFRAKTVDNASGYNFTTNTYSQTEFKTIETDATYLNYDIVSNLSNKLKVGQNLFEIYALGGELDGEFYINSDIAKINATMLNPVTDIKTENGNLVWKNDTSTIKFKVLINGIYEDLDSKADAEKLLEKYSDELSINIKSLGNVTDQKCYTNILLDSRFIGTLEEDSFIPVNFDCKKLNTATYFAVNEGYITANKPNENISYEIYCDSIKFADITTIKEEKIEDITYAYLISNSMYESLESGKTYTIKIKFITDSEKTINSNLSSEIKIMIPQAIEKVDWSLRLKSEGETNYYDLADTYLTWEDKETGDGYVAYVNDKLTYLDINEFKPTDLEDKFTFKVGIKGASNKNESGAYILNSKLTELETYFILSAPKVSVKNGLITWETVANATGYYVYLNGNVHNNTALNSLVLDIPVSGEYEIAVQAVSITENFFAGKKAFYREEDSSKSIIVEKLNKPKKFLLENGRLYWEEGIEGITNFDLTSVMGLPLEEAKEKFLEQTSSKSPFTYTLENIGEQKLVLSFRNGDVKEDVEIEAGYFLTPTEKQLQMLEKVAGIIGMSENYNKLSKFVFEVTGWPTHLQLFDDFAEKVPSGEYNLFVRQNGNDYDYLNSLFNEGMNVYVPGAPKTNITFENDSYILNWNKITLPAKFSDGDTKYTVFGDKGEEEKIILAKDITTTRLNLTELVENGVLTSEFTNVYVVVQGNNKGALNGKSSAKIEIEVLEKVDASVVEGILTWNSQTSASAYEIVYKGGEFNEEYKLKTTENSWLGEQLEEGYSYKDVTIKALGTELKQVSKLVLAGPVTNIGELVKLEKPVWYIENGIIKWEDIENSSKYTAIHYKDLVGSVEKDFDGDHTIVKEDLLSFVTNLTGNITYFLKTIGTVDLTLGEETTAYINSNYTDSIYTYRHEEIKGITCKDGQVEWEFLKYNDENIKNYILTFHREGTADIIIDLQKLAITRYDGYSYKYEYDGKELEKLIADTYTLTIEGYAKGNSNEISGNDTNFALTNGGRLIYVLRSVPQQEAFTVTKLAKPENVDVTNGRVCWEDASSDEESIFELEFTDTSSGKIIISNAQEDRKDEFKFDQANGVWTWCGYVNKDMNYFNVSKYTLNVRRIAINEHQMNSDYAEYRAVVDGEERDYNTIIQLGSVRDADVSIKLKDISGTEKYVISWEGYTLQNGLNDTQVSYLFEYYTESSKMGTTSEVKQIITSGLQKYVIYDELAQSEGTDLLVYRIQVLAGNEDSDLKNYLNSRKTREFSIEKPTSVNDITFNAVSQTFEWEYENDEQNRDLEFIINDYLITDKEDIYDITNIDKYEKSVYYLDVQTGKGAYSYSPLAVGLHVVSVEVSIRNAGTTEITAFKSGAVYYKNDDGKYSEEMNLFASGNGTSASPYIIESEKQFNNMRYRSSILPYINKALEFKQNAHLTINANIVENETGKEYYGFMNEAFNAVYDGNYYSITVNASLAHLNEMGGLFSEVGTKGKIKNLHILFDISGTALSTGINIGLLTQTNNGTISNILVGDIKKTITIEKSSSSVQLSMVAYKNNGILEKIVNNYNITIIDDNNANNLSQINLGVMAYENKGTIWQSGNNGKITINAREGANVGGITAKMTDGSLLDCYNKGNIDFSYNSDKTKTYYIGGIVGNIDIKGNSTGGYIRNCYSLGMFDISHNNTNPGEVYVGGLVGKASNAKYINNSYSDVTLNIQSAQTIVITASIKVLVGYTEVNTNINSSCYSTQSSSLAGGAELKYEVLGWNAILQKLNENDGTTDNTFENENSPVFSWEKIYNENKWKENN